MGRIAWSTLARFDLIDAADFYEREKPGESRRLYDDVDATIALIRTHPDIGEHYWNIVRRFRCHTFPYYVYYHRLSDGLRIVAIGHQSRRLTMWRARLR